MLGADLDGGRCTTSCGRYRRRVPGWGVGARPGGVAAGSWARLSWPRETCLHWGPRDTIEVHELSARGWPLRYGVTTAPGWDADDRGRRHAWVPGRRAGACNARSPRCPGGLGAAGRCSPGSAAVEPPGGWTASALWSCARPPASGGARRSPPGGPAPTPASRRSTASSPAPRATSRAPAPGADKAQAGWSCGMRTAAAWPPRRSMPRRQRRGHRS